MEIEQIKVVKDGIEYDFTPYQDEDMMKNYHGFIGPIGEFYRVRSIYEEADKMPHNSWAKRFIEYHNLKTKNEKLTFSQQLIKEFNFVLCTSYAEVNKDEQEMYVLPNCDGIYTAERCAKLCNNELQLNTIKTLQRLNYGEEKSSSRSR